MRGFLLAILALGGAVAVTAGAAVAAAPAPPRASLQSFVCQTAIDPPTRGVSVKAVMRPVPMTEHMEVRFDLLRARRRFGDFRVLKVKAGILGKWVTPTNPTLGQLPTDIWEPTGEVADLSAPAYYRLRVSFRWLGTSDQRLAEQSRTSPTCFEPELRPNLVVRSITIASLPNQSGDAYAAVVTNRGATAAGQFEVQLSEGAAAVDTTIVPGLDAHRLRRIVLEGPACNSGEVITVTADPGHQVDVSTRIGSSLSTVCS